jgi:hypothetical protein
MYSTDPKKLSFEFDYKFQQRLVLVLSQSSCDARNEIVKKIEFYF